MDGAQESLMQARKLYENQKFVINWYVADYLMAQFEFNTQRFEEKSKYKELNRITAHEYLQKARTMFQEMDHQWDLDELDKITSDV